MKCRSKSKCASGGRPPAIAAFLAIGAWFPLWATPVMAGGQECQNQLEIDTCKLGCTATGDVCGALCGAAVDVCTGLCIGGCATTCAIDCCAGFCTGSDACRSCIGNCEDICEEGCQLDCDDCIFDCERDCESICRPFKKIGESCAPLVDRCADGLTCWPFLFQCFPSENDNLYSDEECRSLYSSGVHQGAIDGDVAWSFGTGGASAVGVSETLETGNVYGPDGRYGCFFTICLGGTTDVEVGLFAATGIYISYDDFKGESVAFVEEAGEVVVFATSQIINTSGELIGTADALSVELSLLPIAIGVYDCTTIVNTVGIRQPDGSLMPVNNSAPVAICDDQVACADSETCVAEVSVDGGSTDPDNDPIVLTQDPPGPYGIGWHEVILEVSDLDGAFDTCVANVQVDDCDAPEITCPEPINVDCQGDGGAVLDPGMATVTDCTEVMVTEPGEVFFPVGTTQAMYTAVDEAGNEASCETAVTVVDEDPPVVMEVMATPDVLWPPNNQMQRVSIEAIAEDVCDPELDCEVIEVVSDEPPGPGPGNGNGNGPKDYQLVGGMDVMLRAARDGFGDGRVYTLTVECRDDSGNAAQGVTTVTVSHDQRRRKNMQSGHGQRRGH